MRLGLLVLFLALIPDTSAADPIANEMVLVPAGTFIQGDGVAACGVDEREVTLTRDYWLGQHEVTNLEYMEVLQWAFDQGYVTVPADCGESGDALCVRDHLDGSDEELLTLDSQFCEIQFDRVGTFYLRESPSTFAQAAYPVGYDPTNHPVKMVTWYGSVRYCDWLSMQAGLPRAYYFNEQTFEWSCNGGDPYGARGFRLPTDAEWEYAARFDDERVWPWGDEDPECTRANHSPDWPTDSCVGWSFPVGSCPDAPDVLGLWDMAGNLWEWCNDGYVCSLGTDPASDPNTPGDYWSWRVMHGGSFINNDSRLRNAYRTGIWPNFSTMSAGFRIARTVPSASNVGANVGRSPLHLAPNTPNPFAGSTQITYSIPPDSPATLVIYDPSGRLVRTLASGQLHGQHTVSWNGTNDAGDPVEAGAYFYKLTVGEESVSRRMLLIR